MAHNETPTKVKVQESSNFAKKTNISFYKEDVFRTFNVKHRQGHEMLKESASSRRLHNDPDRTKTRGQKSLISSQKIREMKRLFEEEGF
jgi:hypothetical protein